jgi:hypothetical protein
MNAGGPRTWPVLRLALMTAPNGPTLDESSYSWFLPSCGRARQAVRRSPGAICDTNAMGPLLMWIR